MSTLTAIKSLIRSNGFRKYFENTSWLFFEKAFRMGIVFLVGVMVARYLSPENYGILSYAAGFVGIFGAFTKLGLDEIIVRDLVRRPEERDMLLGTAFVLKLMGVLVLFISISVGLLFTSNDALTNIIIFIIASAEIFRAFIVIDMFYRSEVRAKYTARVQLFQIFVTSGLKVAFVLMGLPLIYFATITVIDAFTTALGFIYTYHREKLSIFRWKFDWQLARRIFRESLPLTLFAFAIGVQSRIDQVMLGEMIGQEEVGHYSVAYSLIHALGFVPMALLGSFAPAITKAKSTSKELYHHRLLNFYRLMFASFLVVALPFMLFGEEFIVLFFGEPYRRAGFVLSLLSITLIFSHMGVGKSAFITNESLFRYAFATAVVGALINIGANYVLIPHYASVGAVIASIISFSVSNYVLDFFFKRTRGNIKRLLYGMLTFWKLTNIK